jgi:asparagine synthase (glutamine-hydrolysing)
VSGPQTLFAGIKKLPPAHLLTVTAGLNQTLRRYWQTRPGRISDESELKFLVEDAHRIRLGSIWKPAVFLSGGIDSTAAASFLPKGSMALTFQSEVSIDETRLAKETASRFGLSHEAVSFGGEQEGLLKKAVWALEEPLGDSIILPTVALAQAASRHTRVVFSGEGADEIFGGYVHHLVFQRIQQARKWLGRAGSGAMASLVERAPLALLERLTPYPGSLGREGRSRLALALKEGRVSALTNLFDCQLPGSGGRGEREKSVRSLRELMDLDLETWLPDYTLVRLDKILMSFGLEGRLPFLDHRIAEHASALGPESFIRGACRKVALRQAMETRLGKTVTWRPKKPFVADLSKLRGREPESEAAASCERLLSRGILQERLGLTGAPPFLMAKRAFALRVLDEWSRAFEVEA